MDEGLVRQGLWQSMKRLQRSNKPVPLLSTCSTLTPRESLEEGEVISVYGRLHISDHHAARNPVKLARHNIVHIICTANDVPRSRPLPSMQYYTFPATEDPDDDLGMAAYFQDLGSLYLQLLITTPSTENILIHCYAGVNRSATAIAYLLIRFHGFTMRQALELLQCRRPAVNPSPLHLEHLRGAEKTLARTLPREVKLRKVSEESSITPRSLQLPSKSRRAAGPSRFLM